ncbi:NGN domain-containing protein [Treponema brennaborense DSM 12168]|uniref:NGN domain-containing protein n=2 Tax=Treponema TaxID=157 RepID=F4LQH0_TREBD|nr:NGN domain-containing protein [Treponema brennaborense DSM 12168]
MYRLFLSGGLAIYPDKSAYICVEESPVLCYYYIDMNYYAVQVRTLKEEAYIASISRQLEDTEIKIQFLFPKRRLIIRRQGEQVNELMPLFPGYVFIETEKLSTELYNVARSAKYFSRFLPNNQNICSLSGKDLAVLKHFIGFGAVAESSKVYFDENDRIVVTSGPLHGLEGSIVKVDRRKHRAKVKLDFANECFLLDLAFDIIGKNTVSDGGCHDSTE